MLSRSLLFAGLLLVSGCAYDAGYYESGYAREPGSTAGYYSPVGYGSPYRPGSPVYGAPYRSGPVMGGIYAYGDADDVYGGPVFSPYHGIRCDRRRQACWGKNGPDARWTGRFFGHRNSNGTGNRAWVYQVPKNPDGSGAPTFLPNGCGGNGRPPCP